MSKILSYSNIADRNGSQDWLERPPYSDDDIAQIQDPDGGLAEQPRTAIPSPFAQLDLVKNAFKQLANPQLQGARSHQRLVSNALDVAQLFFDFENHKDHLRIVRWNRNDGLAQLKANPRHRLYGETLELFLNSDKVYNFDLLEDWYILMWDQRVLGGTSPASVVMAAPATTPISEIKVEQGVTLFGEVRHLWERDEDFVYYMYLLMNAYPTLRAHAGEVYSYMLNNLNALKSRRPKLYERIVNAIPNLQSMPDDNAARAIIERLEKEYDRFNDLDVNVLGARFYHKRSIDIRQAAADSDFVISPTIAQPAGEALPLVLRTGFNGTVEGFKYIDKLWDSATIVMTDGKELNERKLPDTAIHYPFVTTTDMLADTLVNLDGGCVIDDEHFFNGNLKSRTAQPSCGYLLPLKPLFFKYFDTDYLKGTIAGRNVLELEECNDGSVLVTLRLRVHKGENRYMELSRKYLPSHDPTWEFDERRGTGRLVSVSLSASVFPFVKTNNKDDYTVSLFSIIKEGGASLKFYKEGMSTDRLNVTDHKRSTGVGYQTTYYDVNGSFDFMQAQLTTPLGSFDAMIVPRWPHYEANSKELIFAVDFGTTNTHVEWAERGRTEQPFTFDYNSAQTLIASLHAEGSLDLASLVQSVEFLPREIDEVYGFPLRSALVRNANSGTGTNLFSDVNIPFLYERRYFNGDQYDVMTNLKWNGNPMLAKAFLRELTLLIKAKAMLENANLDNVHIVYFYPVSMGGNDRQTLEDTWRSLFATYISDNTSHLTSYPESLAPAYYYSGSDVVGSSYVSIDIGGGTCDTVIYQPQATGSVPVAISSFRFAGNAIFGDGFTDKDSDNNPLVKHYACYFKKMIENDKGHNISALASILNDIMEQKRSEDINAFLFSIENVEQLRNLRKIDRDPYSYNHLLREDAQRRIIFMYFYAAIIYYIACAMKHRGYVMPKQIYFSGTGSKILNILGAQERVTMFTQKLLERVFGQTYTERFEIKIETEAPKQITCKGGIKLQTANLDGAASHYTTSQVKQMRYCYSMIDIDKLTMQQMEQEDIRDKLVQEVRTFNDFFIALCDTEVKDEFGIENNVLQLFSDVVNDSLANYMLAGINTFLKGRYNPIDEIEDVPFFYPIIGSIRLNLLRNMSNDVIGKYKA